MRPAPARLKLHPGPARAVGTAVEVLSMWIDAGHLRLGGGTRTDSHVLTNPEHGHVAADLWHHVFTMLDSDLDYVPPISQGEGNTGHRSGRHGR